MAALVLVDQVTDPGFGYPAGLPEFIPPGTSDHSAPRQHGGTPERGIPDLLAARVRLIPAGRINARMCEQGIARLHATRPRSSPAAEIGATY
jgi:hypothetical protein